MEQKNGLKALYWSPGMPWKVDSGAVVIAGKVYEVEEKLIKMIYFESQEGKTKQELFKSVTDEFGVDVSDLISELVKDKVLMNSLPDPKEVFGFVEDLIPMNYPIETFIDPNLFNKFKEEQLTRTYEKEVFGTLKLNDDEFPEAISKRVTTRKFSESKIIEFEEFSRMLSVFRQSSIQSERRYNYASDGGLYPVDVYVYVKNKKVRDIKGGLYFYEPLTNEVKLVSKTCVITEKAHFTTNKEIFRDSAISLFFVYNSVVNGSKYRGMGYHYAAIDCGIMVQLLTQIIESEESMGLCSIGEMDFNKIKKYFNLPEGSVMIHTVEIGKKI